MNLLAVLQPDNDCKNRQ